MKEVVAARQRVMEAEGRLWEEREASELKAEFMTMQLHATQVRCVDCLCLGFFFGTGPVLRCLYLCIFFLCYAMLTAS